LVTGIILIFAFAFMVITLIWGDRVFAFIFVNTAFTTAMLVLVISYYWLNGYEVEIVWFAILSAFLTLIAALSRWRDAIGTRRR
jgi:hypothetical protein